MATQLEIINKVQRRLREGQTASIATNEYSVLLADFLNQIIEEMNDDHDWTQLETEVTADVVAGTSDYTLTVKNTATLRYLADQPMAYMFDDDTVDGTGDPLILMNPQSMNDCRQRDRDESSTYPQYFALIPSNTSDTIELQLWPEPEEDRFVRLQFWVPEGDLAVDGTDDNTQIYLPNNPMYLGTLYLALNERGEELGEPGGVAEKNYQRSLSSAIYTDMINRMRTNEYESWRD